MHSNCRFTVEGIVETIIDAVLKLIVLHLVMSLYQHQSLIPQSNAYTLAEYIGELHGETMQFID